MDREIYIMCAPLVLAVVDVLTGYAAAKREGNVNSTVMRDGLWNKLGEICAIVVGRMFEMCITLFGTQQLGVEPVVPVCTGICAYLCVYEFTSILENIGRLSPAIAKKLVQILGIDPDKMGGNGIE